MVVHVLNIGMPGFGELVYTFRSVYPETQELRLYIRKHKEKNDGRKEEESGKRRI